MVIDLAICICHPQKIDANNAREELGPPNSTERALPAATARNFGFVISSCDSFMAASKQLWRTVIQPWLRPRSISRQQAERSTLARNRLPAAQGGWPPGWGRHNYAAWCNEG